VSENLINGIALILLLIPFFLISIGTTQDIEVLWWIGVTLIIIGALIPPVTRYTFAGDDEEG